MIGYGFIEPCSKERRRRTRQQLFFKFWLFQVHARFWVILFVLKQIQRKLDAVRCLHKPLHDAERQLRMRLEGVHRSLGPPQQTLKDLNSALLQVSLGLFAWAFGSSAVIMFLLCGSHVFWGVYSFFSGSRSSVKPILFKRPTHRCTAAALHREGNLFFHAGQLLIAYET